MDCLAVLVPSSKAQRLRVELESQHLWDKTRKLQKVDDQNVAIPVNCTQAELLSVLSAWPESRICNITLPPSKYSLFQSPIEILKVAVSSLLEKVGLSESLIDEIPQKWERHGDLIIIPSSAFTSPLWLDLGDVLWISVAHALSCKRIARHSVIANDKHRSSQVTMVLGTNGKVTHKDNGIQYDVTKCMFSAGNVTEKLRVSQFDCSDQIVVDLFSGIGYFTLPFLVHAKARHVHACEWNPDAIAALRENLLLNGVVDKCTIHEGDNRKLQIEDIADRVNLGLIPTSEASWPIAVRVLKPSGGFLHVHNNVTVTLPTRHSSCNSPKNIDKEKTSDLHSCCQSANQCQRENVNAEKLAVDGVEALKFTDPGSDFTSRLDPNVKVTDKVLSSVYFGWSSEAACEILGLLKEIKGGHWNIKIFHIEKVKSYAPHIDHVVLDLECRPV